MPIGSIIHLSHHCHQVGNEWSNTRASRGRSCHITEAEKLTSEELCRPGLKVDDGSLISQEPGVEKARGPGRVGTVTTQDARPRAAGRTKGLGLSLVIANALEQRTILVKRPAGAKKPDTEYLSGRLGRWPWGEACVLRAPQNP